MFDEGDKLHVQIAMELIRSPRLLLSIQPPLHFLVGVALRRNACKALGNELRGVVRTRGSPTRLGLCHDISNTRGGHFSAADRKPLCVALNHDRFLFASSIFTTVL